MFFTTNRLGYEEGRRTSLFAFRILSTSAMYLFCFVFYLLVVSTRAQTPSFLETAQTLNAMCRDLLGCTIRKNCVQLDFLQKSFTNATLSKQLYDDLDKGVDYGCIFTSGCLDECNRCPLCQTSKEQLVDVLSGNRRETNGECSVLVNCAAECIERSNSDFTKINYRLRHQCAFHCFDGTCPKCSAFVTRIFNQICVSGELRKRVPNFNGYCYEMFRSIVYAKFEDEFQRTNRTPSIGVRTPGLG